MKMAFNTSSVQSEGEYHFSGEYPTGKTSDLASALHVHIELYKWSVGSSIDVFE